MLVDCNAVVIPNEYIGIITTAVIVKNITYDFVPILVRTCHLKKMTPNSDLQLIHKESGNSMTTAKIAK